MTPRELIGTARIPGGEELQLFRHGGDFMIVLDRNELMSSRMSGSEEALAVMTCARLGGRKAPHILIGGYGMGFTLARGARRARSPRRASPWPNWCRRSSPGPADRWRRSRPAVSMIRASRCTSATSRRVIAQGLASYDAILLDVDNGPDGLVRAANDRLYSLQGLASAKAALRPGGVLAIWSAAPDPVFARRLAKAGFAVDEVVVRARSNGKGPRHVIWFATRP